MVHHCSICLLMPLIICYLELDHYPPFDPLQWDNAEDDAHDHEYCLRSLSPHPIRKSKDPWSIHPDSWLSSWVNSSTSSLWGSDLSVEGNGPLPSLVTISKSSKEDSEVRVAVRDA